MAFTGQAGMGTVIASELVTFVGGPASGYRRARSLGRLNALWPIDHICGWARPY